LFDHVTIRVSDREASRRFYELSLATLGRGMTHRGEDFDEWRDFSLAQASDEKPVTRRLHVGFVAPSRAHVDTFWRTVTGTGYRDDGAPGPRPQYSEHYYGGFVLDPDGNSVEAMHGGDEKRGGNWIDHLWIRVADLDAAKGFFATVAPVLGLTLRKEFPERVHFAARDRSLGW
jgi:catechol 2,3-dioxygenase-like lactoylglutathione lyase family enzyme